MDKQVGHWDYAAPHVIEHVVQASEIDGLDHVNNVHYLQWLEDVAWSHSRALGISPASYRELDRGMVVRRHELDYLLPALLGDVVHIATWVTASDQRLRMERRYQVWRPADGKSLLRARTDWVCIKLSTGKPTRMPPAFIDGYGAALL